MPVLNDERIPYGLCDIYIGGTKMGLQADKAELTIEPTFKDIKVEDFGDEPFDKRLSGYKIGFKAVMATESAENLKYGLMATEIQGADGKTAYVDSPLGASLRKSGKTLRIHPRELPEDNKDYDCNIFLAVPASKYSRPYGNEQGKVEIQLEALPKEGFDVTKPENYFRIGDLNLGAAKPTITSITNTTVTASNLPVVTVIKGTDFTINSVAVLRKSGSSDVVLRTLFDSATQLTAIIASGLTADTYDLVVRNGALESTAKQITVS